MQRRDCTLYEFLRNILCAFLIGHINKRYRRARELLLLLNNLSAARTLGKSVCVMQL